MPRIVRVSAAPIWTGDARTPWARGMTLEGDRVAAVDPGAPPKRADASRACIVPGLIDAHLHLVNGGLALDQLDLSKARTRRAFEQAIAAEHARLPAGQWLIAHSWSDAFLEDGGKAEKAWLQECDGSGGRPCVVYRVDLHAALVNDAVLKLCKSLADPPGGYVERDATGAATGVLVEAAAWQYINPLVPEASSEQRRRALLSAQQHAHAHGLTTINTMEYAKTVREVYQPLRDALTLRCGITLLDRIWPVNVSLADEFVDDIYLRILGFKAFIDGTLGSRTARMLEPYADAPAERGLLVELARAGRLNVWAALVAGAGLSPSMHAIGDQAVRLALEAADILPEGAHVRIEHAQHIAANDVKRFRGRVASMQPLHKALDARYVEARVGRERLSGTFAFRSLLDAGATLAFGSDWPVVSLDPMRGTRVAVTGMTDSGDAFLPEQNISPEEALAAYTYDAARALRMPEVAVLQRGRLADFVVLDRDPLQAEWRDAPPCVLMTVAGGRIVFDGQADARVLETLREQMKEPVAQ